MDYDGSSLYGTSIERITGRTKTEARHKLSPSYPYENVKFLRIDRRKPSIRTLLNQPSEECYIDDLPF